MRLLLTQSITGLGRIGEVVDVKDGYGRNYLRPKGLAVAVTPDNIRRLEVAKAIEAEHEAKERAEMTVLADRLSGVTSMTVPMKAGDDGHLYGSVNPQVIVEMLASEGHTVDPRFVKMEPIKAVGEYTIPIQFHPDVSVDIKIWVVAEGGGAEAPAPQPAAESAEAGS